MAKSTPTKKGATKKVASNEEIATKKQKRKNKKIKKHQTGNRQKYTKPVSETKEK